MGGRSYRPVGRSGCFPWLTLVLLGLFIAVFVIEQRVTAMTGGRPTSPSLQTLVALGGLSRTLAERGEWYRLLTAPFLHAGLAHLAANGVAFALAGYALERLVGHAWMFCIFAAGALAGAAASLAFSAPSTVSVGASGAIMAMLTALFMISFRLPPGAAKITIQIQSLRVAIPALIPLRHAAGSVHVDYGAHFGGAVFGVMVGFLLLRTWHEADPFPRFEAGAAALAVVAALSFGTAGLAVAKHYPSYGHVAQLAVTGPGAG